MGAWGPLEQHSALPCRVHGSSRLSAINQLFRRRAAPLRAALVSFGTYVYIGQYLQLVRGLTPLGAGSATLPVFLGYIIGSFVAPPLAARFGAVPVMIAGLLVGAVGFALLGLSHEHTALPFVIGALWLSTIDRELLRIPLAISPASYVAAACVVAFAAFASALIVRRQSDRLDLVAVLKARD